MDLIVKCIGYEKEFVFYTDSEFTSGLSYYDNSDIFVRKLSLQVFDTDGNRKANNLVGEIEVILLDEDELDYHHLDVLDVVDTYSGEASSAMGALLKFKPYTELPFLTGNTVYVENFYIYPKYRNKGIATYIWENFGEILKYCIGRKICAITTSIYPILKDNEEAEKMIKIMSKVLERTGFTKTDFDYVKVCITTEELMYSCNLK